MPIFLIKFFNKGINREGWDHLLNQFQLMIGAHRNAEMAWKMESVSSLQLCVVVLLLLLFFYL